MKNTQLNRSFLAIFVCLALPALVCAQTNIVSGSGSQIVSNQQHPNGNFYDQVLLTGQTVTLQSVGSRVLRCSFLDTNGDIVQCEFSGPGQFTITLDPATYVAAAPAPKYNQPGVNYVTGRPTVSVTGNTADTYVSIFTVGRLTAYDPTGAYNFLLPVSATNNPANSGSSLFAGQTGTSYDGLADVQLLQVSGSAIARIAAGNVRFGGSSGMTGIFAPNTTVTQRAILHDIKAAGSATPVLQFGAGSTFSLDSGAVLLAGGNLTQPNNAAIDVTSGTGTTLTSIVTTSNVDSNNTSITRATVSGTVTFTGGASGSLRIDGAAVVGSNGSGSGAFAATFQELTAGANSPISLTGTVGVTWAFTNSTWTVTSSTNTSGVAVTAELSGTYTYVLSNNNSTFTLTMNYNQIKTTTTLPIVGSQTTTLNIGTSSNPPLPKTLAMTVNRTSDTTGTYSYTLTMSNGTQTSFQGNYSPASPLGLPSS